MKLKNNRFPLYLIRHFIKAEKNIFRNSFRFFYPRVKYTVSHVLLYKTIALFHFNIIFLDNYN